MVFTILIINISNFASYKALIIIFSSPFDGLYIGEKIISYYYIEHSLFHFGFLRLKITDFSGYAI